MRVLFAGYGSIAKRHISNLQSIFEERNESLSVDLLRTSCDVCPAGINKVHTSVDGLEAPYDAVFITNPTSAHYETLSVLLDQSDIFFIEKPVFDRTDVDLASFEESAEKLFYVACPLRYTNVLQWVKRSIDFSNVYAIRAISSSYLPDWRPDVDYRETYSAHTELGGGVHIDLVHEWDYLVSLIGFPSKVHSIIAQNSKLEIDSPDTALYIADYGTKTVELHLDYFGRSTKRQLELYMANDTVICDLVQNRITYERSGTSIDLSEMRDDFQKRELLHFLHLITTGEKTSSSIGDALSILKIAKGEQ